jgi:hypothetical protein
MSFTLPLYATREDVKSAMDSKESARNNSRIDDALDSASRRVEDLCHRVFYPVTATRYFDWPNLQRARAYRLWLERDELISVSSLTSGGVTIASTDYFLEPANDGPPYTRLEIDLDSTAAFASSGTHQRQVAVTGVFGYRNSTVAAGVLAEALDSSETGIIVSDSSLFGVGDVLVCESERMLVTGKAQVDTTATCSAMTAAQSGVSITGIVAGLVKNGEVITIDSERMKVVDVTGTTLTVIRAWDGSVLAAHNVSTAIYAPRDLQVTRGVLGSTAAAHDTATALFRLSHPGPVRQLAIAYAMDQLQQEGSAYARTVGSGESERAASGRAIRELEVRVRAAYGRRRVGAV